MCRMEELSITSEILTSIQALKLYEVCVFSSTLEPRGMEGMNTPIVHICIDQVLQLQLAELQCAALEDSP